MPPAPICSIMRYRPKLWPVVATISPVALMLGLAENQVNVQLFAPAAIPDVTEECHMFTGSIIGYIEKRCASAADERRRPSRFCPRYVSAVSEARFHDKVGGEAGDVARVRYSR